RRASPVKASAATSVAAGAALWSLVPARGRAPSASPQARLGLHRPALPNGSSLGTTSIMSQLFAKLRHPTTRKWFLSTILVLTAYCAVRLRSNLLVHAAEAGNVKLARFLLAVGADPNAKLYGFHEWDDVAWRLIGLPVNENHREPV